MHAVTNNTTTVCEDRTEAFRRIRLAQLNPGVGKAELERRHGQVWDPAALAADFEVVAFAAPLVVVRRRADGKVGVLEFQHHPRLYFNWQEDRP
jgi:hypothetical protein